MNDFKLRFTTRHEGMPKIAAMLGEQNVPVTRYVEYDQVTGVGVAWYAVRSVENDTIVRCLHDPLTITNDREFRGRIVAWLEDNEYIAPGWPEDTRTCDDDPCQYAPATKGAIDA